MVWLAGAIAFFSMVVVDVWTFRAIGYLPTRRFWRAVSFGLFTVGIVAGFWLGISFTYQVAPDTRYIGFPVPGLVLQLEDGRWVDYVGLLPVVVPFNVIMIASCFLLPVSIGLVVRRLVVGSPPR